MFALLLRGVHGALPHLGAFTGGGDWNVTAECQTLCPDGIIRDSTKAAPHKSASPDPENKTQQELKGNQSKEPHSFQLKPLRWAATPAFVVLR